jgi:acyl-homoserine-lactone acylase
VRRTTRGVDADTILTYGQALDPGSPNAQDQTRLLSQEKWVDFAFTPRQVRESLVRSYRVSGRD